MNSQKYVKKILRQKCLRKIKTYYLQQVLRVQQQKNCRKKKKEKKMQI